MYTSDISWQLPEGVNRTLESLNREQVKVLLPTIVFTALSVLVGTVGNIVVLIVYSRKFKRSNHKYFILMMAYCDVIACTVCMPFHIMDMLHAYTFTNALACRLFRFSSYFTSTTSGTTLLIIAIERYIKICRPLASAITNNMAKKLMLVALIVGFVESFPSVFLFGQDTAKIGENITGSQCFIDDSIKHTSFPAIYNITLMTLSVIYFSGIIVCYYRIARQSYRRNKEMARPKLLRGVEQYSSVDNSAVECNDIGQRRRELNGKTDSANELQPRERRNQSVTFKNPQQRSNKVKLDKVDHLVFSDNQSVGEVIVNDAESRDSNNESRDSNNVCGSIPTQTHCQTHLRTEGNMSVEHASSKVRPGTHTATTFHWRKQFVKRKATTSAKNSRWCEKAMLRITKMMCLITTVFALSFVPHLTLMIMLFVDDTFTKSVSFSEAAIYQFMLRSFIINSFANPVVYACMDRNFRKRCSNLVT